MKFKRLLSSLERNTLCTPGCLDNPYLVLTLNTGSLEWGVGSETQPLVWLNEPVASLTQREFLFWQNPFFRDGYFSSFQLSSLTASSPSTAKFIKTGQWFFSSDSSTTSSLRPSENRATGRALPFAHFLPLLLSRSLTHPCSKRRGPEGGSQGESNGAWAGPALPSLHSFLF